MKNKPLSSGAVSRHTFLFTVVWRFLTSHLPVHCRLALSHVTPSCSLSSGAVSRHTFLFTVVWRFLTSHLPVHCRLALSHVTPSCSLSSGAISCHTFLFTVVWRFLTSHLPVHCRLALSHVTPSCSLLNTHQQIIALPPPVAPWIRPRPSTSVRTVHCPHPFSDSFHFPFLTITILQSFV